ncbi:hypothetical protein DsansV1_C08g0083271 [Dioscorea sansibarensis]
MCDQVRTLGLHVLDLYRKGMISKRIPFPKLHISQKLSEAFLHAPRKLTAVELHEAGVHFEPSKGNKVNDINFDKGILNLPHFVIDGSTESTLLSLMAFEHLHADLEDIVTSNVCFFGELIHSASDVQLLVSKNIISLADVSEEDAAKILNRLTKEVAHDPTWQLTLIRVKVFRYRTRMRGRVNRLLKTRVKKWFSILMNLHFNNPWSTIAIIAAAVGLVLTFIQTYYAIISYKHAKN